MGAGELKVIQSTLFFILGFLCAGFLALIVGPAVWRRAVTLTRKRIEASMPLSLNEIQAETDRVRAEAAMAIRHLEITVKSLKEKNAEQLVEINRGREEVRRLASERTEKAHGLAGFEAKAPELHTSLQRREEQISALTAKLGEAETLISRGASELEELGKMYEDLSFVSSTRQIELAGAEAEIEKLSTDVSRLRRQCKDAERRVAEIAIEKQALQDTLRLERKRLTDREEVLRRQGKELMHLGHEEGVGLDAANGLDLLLGEVETMGTILEPRQADALRSSGGGMPMEVTEQVARLSAERDRLERHLTALAGENRQLRADAAAGAGKGAGAVNGRLDEDALLRDQIQELAAEVVSLTAALEGSDSPIRRALAMPAVNGLVPADPHAKITSLADRVRALQEAASRG